VVRATLRVVLPAAALAAGALVAWRPAEEAVRRHPYFAVREVVVRNARRLSAAEVRAAARIEPGMSVWDVDPADAEGRLRAHDWIRSARVRRELPRRVVIQVREERPVAILALDAPKGGEYYVAAHGRIFAAVGAADSRDFPYVSGLGRADLEAGETFGPRALRRALALVRRTPGVEAVSEVHIDRARGLTLLPVRPPVPIEVGWTGFATRLARLPAVMQLWAGREAELEGVSLLWDDEVIVRMRSARRSGPARRPA
jgi:cell division septal protein FtsQ